MQKRMDRIRLHVALDFSAYSLETFILDNFEPGSTIATDSWKSYNFIEDARSEIMWDMDPISEYYAT